MSFFDQTTGSARSLPSQAPPTLLEKVLAPLEVLLIPNRIVLSGINTIKTALEGKAEFKFVKGAEDVFDIAKDSILANIGISIVTDPFSFIAGIGQLSKAAVLTRRVKTVKSLRDAARITGDKKSARIFTEILKGKQIRDVTSGKFGKGFKEGLISESRGAGVGKRSLVSIGLPFTQGKQFGTFPDLPSLIPSPKSFALQKKAARITQALARGDFFGKRAGALVKIEKELVGVQEELLMQPHSILSGSAANAVARVIKVVKDKFGHAPDSQLVRALQDLELSSIGKANQELGIKAAVMSAKFKVFGDIKSKEVQKEIIQAIEGRFLKGKLQDPAERMLFLGEKEAAELKSVTSNYDRVTKAAKGDRTKIAKAQELFKEQIQDIKLTNVVRERQLDRFAEVWGKLNGDQLQVIEDFGNNMDSLLKTEKALGIDISKLSSSGGMLSFIRRSLSKEAKALRFKSPSLYRAVWGEINTRMGSAFRRKLYPELDLIQLNDLLKRTFKLKDDFFSTSPIELYVKRHREHIKAVHAAQMAHAISRLGAKGVKGTPLTKFLREAGLTPEFTSQFKGLNIPTRIAEDSFRMQKLLSTQISEGSKFLDHAFGVMDQTVNRFYRLALTSPFPAFHFRNFLGNIFLNSIAKDVKLADYGKMMSLQIKGIKGTLKGKDLKLYEMMEQMGVRKGGQFGELEELAGNAGSALREISDRPATATFDRLMKGLGKNVPERNPNGFDPLIGRAFGQFVEDNARGALFLSRLNKGWTPIEAMREVNHYLFDYSKLTPFERARMRPIFLFYTWMRNNIPLMLNTVITDPRKATLYQHLFNVRDDEVPNYLRGQFVLKLGENIFINSPNLPIEDLQSLSVSDADPTFFDQIKRVGQRIASKASPLPKLAFELLTGETAFSRRKLSDQPLSALLSSLSPTSRFIRTIDKIIDPDAPLAIKLLDNLTGTRTYITTPERVAIDRITRNALAQGARKFPVLTSPYPDDDPRTIAIKQGISQIQKLRKKNAR